jgi:cation:H+ antiporter
MIDLHYLLGTALLFILVAYDGHITAGEGILCLLAFVIHTLYILRGDEPNSESESDKSTQKFPLKETLFMLVAAVGIYFSGEYTVTSLEKIALSMDISPAVISLTLLSLGTTLPELAVSFILIRKNQEEEAVGNVLGSCIFNATMIPGLASLFGTIEVPDALLALPIAVFLGATVFFYLLTQDKKISTWEGFLFMLFYVAFLLKTAQII